MAYCELHGGFAPRPDWGIMYIECPICVLERYEVTAQDDREACFCLICDKTTE